MELFDEKGCLTDEGLRALADGQLDELGRLEAAEHLSYCDRCMDRYTALLTPDVLETPAHSLAAPVSRIVWVQMMQSTLGRSAVAAVAAMLALTFWATGVFTLPQALQKKQAETVKTSQTQQDNTLQQAWDACADFWTGKMPYEFFHNNGGK